MKKYRLLIVDDEALIRKGLRARIEYFGFADLEIDEAESGREALEKFRRNGADLALVDISMPDMNGLELIGRVKEFSPATNFVLLSGYAEFSYAQQAIRLGVRAYLNKPVSNEVLREQIDSILKELRAGDAASGGAVERHYTDPEKELNLFLTGGAGDARPNVVCPELNERLPHLFGGGKVYLGILHIGSRDREDRRLSGGQLSAMRQVIHKLFMEAPCRCGRMIVNSYQNPQRMFVLFAAESGAGLRRQAEAVFFAVRQGVERRMNVRVAMGVSRMADALSADCLAEARMALRQRSVHGRSNIYFCEDSAALDAQPIPEAELELLRKHMARGDRSGARRQLERLFPENQNENCTAVYLHVLWVRVVSQMMSVFSSMDHAATNQLLNQISRMETMVEREEIINTLCRLMDVCMGEESGREMRAAGKIGYALEYIREHFNEEIVINDLAARLDMSPSYFSSMFKKEVGQSTMQYITGLRVELAKEYLANSDASVAVIAKDVGYVDSQYFFRVFKKTTGMTPLQYRQGLNEPERIQG